MPSKNTRHAHSLRLSDRTVLDRRASQGTITTLDNGNFKGRYGVPTITSRIGKTKWLSGIEASLANQAVAARLKEEERRINPLPPVPLSIHQTRPNTYRLLTGLRKSNPQAFRKYLTKYLASV